jgi:hypothetical protein
VSKRSSLRSITLVCASVLVAAFLIACNSDEERIDRANEAAANESAPATTEPSDSASVFDLRTGDCFASRTQPGDATDDVATVSCGNDSWDFAVLNSFLVDSSDDRYPGEDAFNQESNTRCDLAATTFFFPTADSWSSGDRTINCLIEDDVFFVPAIGQCYSLQLAASDRRACESSHVWEAFEVVTMEDGLYPGDTVVGSLADQVCVPAFERYVGRDYDSSSWYYTSIAPTAGTWAVLGNRTLACYLHTEQHDDVTGSALGSGQ